VFRDSVEAVHPDAAKKVEELYIEYQGKLGSLGKELIERLDKDLPDIAKKSVKGDEKDKRESRSHAEANGGNAVAASSATSN
jgi:hypothetical protein